LSLGALGQCWRIRQIIIVSTEPEAVGGTDDPHEDGRERLWSFVTSLRQLNLMDDVRLFALPV
jgi:hypothetical protein